MVLLSLIVFNLSIAAVIDGLNQARNDFYCCVRSEDISKLISLWSEYDPKAKGWITFEQLVCLLYELERPLGLARDLSEFQKKQK